MRVLSLCATCILLISAPVTASLSDLIADTGVTGGLIVHLGCGDGRQTAGLYLGETYLVHGLEQDAATVRKAREHLHSLRLSGKVSVSAFDGAHLPYVDDLVNVLIDSGGGGSVPRAEIMRVLVPGGVAYLEDTKIVKPWPAELDQWGHFLHGPDNNAVSKDRRADIPRSIQWVSEPRWGRSHEEMASMSAAVAADGRLYYVVDNSPLVFVRFLSKWELIARDAFNGTLLWKKPIARWNDHLRHFRSGPTHLPRRLVAVGDRVYVTLGFGRPVSSLDGSTGRTLKEYKGTEHTEEILVDKGVLYLAVGTSERIRRGGGLHRRSEPEPTAFRFIVAMNAESGNELWRKSFSEEEHLLPLTLTVKGERVYYQSSRVVACLDAKSGKERWATPRQTPARRMAWSSPTMVATDHVLLCADRNIGNTEVDEPSAGTIEWGVHGWNQKGFARKAKCTLRAYATGDGKELWSAPCSEGYNSPVDIFVVNDTVWVGTGYKGLDLRTGEVKRQLSTKAPRVGMAHHRCYRNKATERLIFTGKSGIEVLSLDKGWISNNSWIRGTCQYGIVPANGFVYAPPDACACFLTVKMPGFFASAPQRDSTGRMPFPDEPVLEQGPAYGSLGQEAAVGRATDWPMYRHDVARSGQATSSIPAARKETWRKQLGGRLTQPIMAGDTVFIASVDAHTLYALSAENGRELWHLVFDGRIDSAPTAYKGGIFFGSAHGWIYCVRARDGALAWRFRVAPQERLVCAYGQLESIWPAHGSVLIQNDTVYVTAGRSSYLDGGIVLYRLDPASGKELSRTVLYHLDPSTGKQLVPEARFNMEGTASDIVSGDGEHVFLKYFSFDRMGKRVERTQPRLFCITGFLGEDWFVRSYWIIGRELGAGWGGWARAANRYPAGRILCFNDDRVYGYGRRTVAGGAVGHKADAYHLFCSDRKASSPEVRPSKERRGGKAARRGAKVPKKAPPIWSKDGSLVVRSMVLGKDRLAVAGPVDLGKRSAELLAFENEAEALAAFMGHKGVYLRILNASDGATLSEVKLTAMPVFDGMAAAGGKLLVSLKNGAVLCFSE